MLALVKATLKLMTAIRVDNQHIPRVSIRTLGVATQFAKLAVAFLEGGSTV